MNALTVWANPFLTEEARNYLVESVRPHKLVFGLQPGHVLDPGAADHQILEAEIVFGQPDPGIILESKKLRWIHLSSAGYTPYDTTAFRNGLKALSAVLTNSSAVFDEPCAQHIMAWLLADARRLFPSYDNQMESRGWPQNQLREKTHLLTDQTILIVGYGSIGRRLAELLAPYAAKLTGYRRSPQPGSPIPVIGPESIRAALAEADHIINILPQNPETHLFFDTGRFAQIKKGARYYTIGRGATTDQEALLSSLQSGHLSAAYLDVTAPEPLPPDHPLWSAPNCFITPHTGGGHANEAIRIVEHFLANLRRFDRGEPLTNRVF